MESRYLSVPGALDVAGREDVNLQIRTVELTLQQASSNRRARSL